MIKRPGITKTRVSKRGIKQTLVCMTTKDVLKGAMQGLVGRVFIHLGAESDISSFLTRSPDKAGHHG